MHLIIEIINAFIIYYTLLHEIIHAISLLIRGNDNYLVNENEFTKYKKIKEKKVGFILKIIF